MSSQAERYKIIGKAVPYRPDNETTPLAELSIVESRLEIALVGLGDGPLICGCEIWEHTIYELEGLSAALRQAAAGPFPELFEAPTPNSQIGTFHDLSLAVYMELGYSLEEPGAGRARVFCSSRMWGPRSQEHLGIAIEVAVSGAYGEVVVEPSHAVELADWIDRQIAELWPSSDSPAVCRSSVPSERRS